MILQQCHFQGQVRDNVCDLVFLKVGKIDIPVFIQGIICLVITCLNDFFCYIIIYKNVSRLFRLSFTLMKNFKNYQNKTQKQTFTKCF